MDYENKYTIGGVEYSEKQIKSIQIQGERPFIITIIALAWFAKLFLFLPEWISLVTKAFDMFSASPSLYFDNLPGFINTASFMIFILGIAITLWQMRKSCFLIFILSIIFERITLFQSGQSIETLSIFNLYLDIPTFLLMLIYIRRFY